LTLQKPTEERNPALSTQINSTMEKSISRQEFLQRAAMASTALLLSSIEGVALSQSPKRIKVAVIGCGSVSTQYLPHLSKSPYVELVSACDIIPERARKQADTYRIPHHFPHIDQLLAGPTFDLLINLTDMQEHGRLNKQALLAGKHIWSEKPMANTYREGKALLDLARQKKLRLWGAPAVVNSPQFAFMAKAIREGKLGKVSSAHAHYGHLGPTWSAFFYEKGGGSLPDLGVYNLATLTGLLGPARSVMAMTSIVTPERTVDNKGKIKVEAEDNAMVLMDHGNGVLSHVQCGFNYFDPYGHEGKGQEKHTITVWGTHGNMGLVGYDWAPFGVDLSTHDHETPQRFVPDPETYVWQQGASVIAEALVTGKEPLIAVKHALHVLEIIEAARESGTSGKKINLQSTFKWPVV
jgi:predicted dehydrogenase